MDRVRTIIALAVVSLGLLRCSAHGPRGYLRPGTAVSDIRSIAVLPFDNISGHPDAGKKVVNLLVTELVRTQLFEIADMGEVEKALRSLRIRITAELDLSKLQNLRERLNVQVILVGSVDEYELRQEKGRTVPVAAISARMLEAQAGDILWVISHIRNGDDWETVFGFGRIISLTRLTQIVVSEMVKSLVRGLSAEAKK